jgi:CHASE3 domain sensor protein
MENNVIKSYFAKFMDWYNRISISKQIAFGITIIMMLTVTLISVSLIIQLKNIHGYQQ